MVPTCAHGSTADPSRRTRPAARVASIFVVESKAGSGPKRSLVLLCTSSHAPAECFWNVFSGHFLGLSDWKVAHRAQPVTPQQSGRLAARPQIRTLLEKQRKAELPRAERIPESGANVWVHTRRATNSHTGGDVPTEQRAPTPNLDRYLVGTNLDFNAGVSEVISTEVVVQSLVRCVGGAVAWCLVVSVVLWLVILFRRVHRLVPAVLSECSLSFVAIPHLTCHSSCQHCTGPR